MNKFIIALLLIIVWGCSSAGSLVNSSNPNKTYIDLYGYIDKDFTYKVNVTYWASSSLKECTYYHLALGSRAPKKHEVSYYPEISKGSHRVQIPLQELEPNTICKWTPVMVYICISSANNASPSCISAFSLSGTQNVVPVTTIACSTNKYISCDVNRVGEINELNRKYRLDLVLK